MQLRLNVPALVRLQFFQFLLSDGFAQPLLRVLLLHLNVTAPFRLRFFQLLVFQLQQKLRVLQLHLSGTAQLQQRSFRILKLLIPVSRAQKLQPLLVLRQRSPTTVSRIPTFRTLGARTPKPSALVPFLRPLPPFARLEPTCIVLIRKQCAHSRFSAVQLSAARVDATTFE